MSWSAALARLLAVGPLGRGGRRRRRRRRCLGRRRYGEVALIIMDLRGGDLDLRRGDMDRWGLHMDLSALDVDRRGLHIDGRLRHMDRRCAVIDRLRGRGLIGVDLSMTVSVAMTLAMTLARIAAVALAIARAIGGLARPRITAIAIDDIAEGLRALHLMDGGAVDRALIGGGDDDGLGVARAAIAVTIAMGGNRRQTRLPAGVAVIALGAAIGVAGTVIGRHRLLRHGGATAVCRGIIMGSALMGLGGTDADEGRAN